MIDVIFIDEPLVVFIEPATTAGAIFVEGAASAAAEIATLKGEADPFPQYAMDTDVTAAIATAEAFSVPKTTTVNGHALSANITLTASDVGAPSGSGTSSGSNTGDQDLSTYALKTYVDAAVVGLWDMKGGQDCSANPNYPAALKGDAYVVTVAGKIGGASGTSVDVGDVFVAIVDNAGGTQASVGTSWLHVEHNLVGALVAANNLADLADAAAARLNLGVPAGSGTSTGTNTGDQDVSGLAAKRAYVSLADGTSITPALIAGDTTCVKQSNTQSAGTLTVNNPTGSPTDGQLLMLRLTCTNAQTFAFGTSYAGTNQLSLPSAATGSGKTDRMLFEYRTAALMWQLIGISFGA